MQNHKEWYINIRDWMMIDLKLSGNELLVYAIIYGFSFDGRGKYYLSLNELARFINISRSTAVKTLNSLVDKKLILKNLRPNESTEYKCDLKMISVKSTLVHKSHYPSTKNTLGDSAENTLPPSVKSTPNIEKKNNKEDYNKSNNKEIKEYTREPEIFDQMSSEKLIEALTAEDKRKKVAQKKEKFGEHENVLLTEDECKKLRAKYSMEDINWIIEKLSNFKLSKGKTYKSDYGAINTWVIQALEEHKKKSNGSSSGSTKNNGNAFTRLAEEIDRRIQFGST